jgi:plasmid stabilization system protein ParE
MEDRYRIVLPSRVANELEKIFDYIHQDSPQNATEMIARILRAIEGLKAFPYRNVAGARSKAPVRSLPVQSYIIFFRVLGEEGVVEILQVRHGARKRPKRFRK